MFVLRTTQTRPARRVSSDSRPVQSRPPFPNKDLPVHPKRRTTLHVPRSWHLGQAVYSPPGVEDICRLAACRKPGSRNHLEFHLGGEILAEPHDWAQESASQRGHSRWHGTSEPVVLSLSPKALLRTKPGNRLCGGYGRRKKRLAGNSERFREDVSFEMPKASPRHYFIALHPLAAAGLQNHYFRIAQMLAPPRNFQKIYGKFSLFGDLQVHV